MQDDNRGIVILSAADEADDICHADADNNTSSRYTGVSGTSGEGKHHAEMKSGGVDPAGSEPAFSQLGRAR